MTANFPRLVLLGLPLLYVGYRLAEAVSTSWRNRRLLADNSAGTQYLTDTGRADIADNSEYARIETLLWSAALLVLIVATILAVTDINPFDHHFRRGPGPLPHT